MANDTEKRISVKYILDSTGFNDSLKGVNQNLKLNKSELKDAEAGVKAFGASTENLTRVQKALGDSIETQSKKMAIYQESIAKAQTKMEANIAARDKLKASLDMEKAKLEGATNAYGKESEVTQNAKVKVDELTQAYNEKNAAVEANAKSINNYTTNLNKADAELKKMQGELANTNKELEAQNSIWLNASKKLEEHSKGLKTVSEGASKLGDAFLKVGAPIVATDAIGAKFFMDFDDGMQKVSTIADTSSENIRKMGDQVINLSNDTGQSTNVLQEALYETISSGVKTGDAMKFLGNATKTAVGGFTDANTAVDGLTTVLNAYGMQASDATKISNQMIVAQNLGKTTFGEMAKSIGLVADTTANVNMKTQDLFSSLAVETAHGIDTSEAISGLRESLSNIIKPTDQATKMASQLGLEFNAAHLKSVGWAQFLKEIQEKTHGNTQEMGQLFGSVQGLNTMITLTSDSGMQLFNESLQQMNSNTDYVGQAFDKVQSGSGVKFKNSLNELKNSMIKLGEASEPIINDLSDDIKIVANALNGMDKSTLQNITTIGLWTVGIGGALKVLGGLGKGISSVEGVLAKVIPKISEYGGKLGNAAGAAEKASKAAGGVAEGLETVSAGAGVAGEAVVGTGIAAEGAGAGMIGLAGSLGGVLVAALPAVAIIGAAGLAGYELAKYMKKETIPSVDLFSSKVEEHNKVMTENGQQIDVVTNKYVKFSEATKKNVGAYVQLDEAAKKSLMDLYVNGTKITQDIVNKTKSQYDEMNSKIKQSIDKRNNDEIAKLKEFFAKSKGISQQEQQRQLEALQNANNNTKAKVDDYENQILQIENNAANKHRSLTQQEQQQIEQIQNKMRDVAVTTMSTTEKEKQVIQSRMGDFSKHASAEEAGEIIKNANKQRDEAVAAANKKFQDVKSAIEYERDVTHTISADQADKMISEAERQRNESVNKAEKTKDGVVNQLNKMHPEVMKEMDTTTGDIKTKWDEVRDWVQNHPIVAKVIKTVSGIVGDLAGSPAIKAMGQVFANATGNDNFEGGLTTLHEKGYEVYQLPRGTKIFNHEASEDMVLKTAQAVAKNMSQSSKNINQYITINSPSPLNPSEIIRKQKQASRELALQWGL
ncbi:phage tail tape measure protein [Clostridium felsineum]|uniref:phage tail tape measure protein n=1 Tax=Clostridium felsineum TaxID=36839 RepID=UPI00214DA8BD|nr:phage tail tape measure protein [Clostridium felsineum]MCR3758150.1 phage tail tape measure protein [Clostridium felsineum]